MNLRRLLGDSGPFRARLDTLAPTALAVTALAVTVLAFSSAAQWRASAQDAAPVDATLDSMRGGRRSLGAERGRRIIVLFYEDRPHVEDNDTFKGELRRFVDDNHLGDRVVIYGVANLGDVGVVPEALVRSMIEPLVDRWGSDILLDWDGVMRRAPFSFATHAANVGIVDRDGHVTYRFTGTLGATERREFYRALRSALR